ncbi:MAG: TlpA disulfide reductase family protein [Bacteroidota bacterium]
MLQIDRIINRLVFVISVCCSSAVNGQSLTGEWKGSFVINAFVQKITGYVIEENASNVIKLDVPERKIYELIYNLKQDGDSVIFSRVNAQGDLFEFKGVRSRNTISGSVTLHNKYMKDKPGMFQLMKSNANILRGQQFPSFSVQTIEGNNISKSDFRGNYLMLDFWATWCAPCVAKRPKLEALKKEHGDQLQIVSISLDKDLKTVKDFRDAKYPMQWYHVLKSEKFKDAFVKAYVPQGLPYGYLMDSEGKVLAFGTDLNAENFEETVIRVFK